MTAGSYQFVIEINADFNQQLTWLDSSQTPINLTGYTAKMEIANVPEPPIPNQPRPPQPPQVIYYTLSSTGTPNSDITITADTGTINLFIPGSITADFTFTSAVYDLVLTAPGGQIYRLLQGPILVSPGVTTLP